ncbi:hypothetical protein [Novipirellula galeiformis]|uniref:hypothetical protein n=1 Tax=Novipirellula galeiformis TaxID=2528004 RepID=UPI0011B57D0A|nr:hypothetical protein [Novipirellula galeiformis]
MDTAFAILSFSVPAVFAFTIRSKTRAILWGTIWFWLLMVTAGQYNLASDSQYNSLAPGLSIVAGWIPGLIYALICIAAAALVSGVYSAFTSRSDR